MKEKKGTIIEIQGDRIAENALNRRRRKEREKEKERRKKEKKKKNGKGRRNN